MKWKIFFLSLFAVPVFFSRVAAIDSSISLKNLMGTWSVLRVFDGTGLFDYYYDPIPPEIYDDVIEGICTWDPPELILERHLIPSPEGGVFMLVSAQVNKKNLSLRLWCRRMAYYSFKRLISQLP